MTQKQALRHALDYIQLPYSDISEKRAARALFVILWLTDINWHTEAAALDKRVGSTAYLSQAFKKITTNQSVAKHDQIVGFFNHLYGWGMKRDEWQATRGDALVQELWDMIHTPAEL